MAKVRHKPSLIGKKVPLPKHPDEAILETFENPGVETVVLKSKEFTSLCPFTGQPDWATVTITYWPKKRCIETKSLKLYLQSYRNFKGTMETIASKIADDLLAAIEPYNVYVLIESTPRGGIEIRAHARRADYEVE